MIVLLSDYGRNSAKLLRADASFAQYTSSFQAIPVRPQQWQSILEIIHVPRCRIRAGVAGAGNTGEFPRHLILTCLSFRLGRIFPENSPLPQIWILFRPFPPTVFGICRNADSAGHVFSVARWCLYYFIAGASNRADPVLMGATGLVCIAQKHVWSAPILQVLECPHGVKVTASMYPASVREFPLPGPMEFAHRPHHPHGLKGS